MQAEAADCSLREGIEALGVKDAEKSAAPKEDNAEQRDTEMTDATEDSATKDEKSNYSILNISSCIVKMHT